MIVCAVLLNNGCTSLTALGSGFVTFSALPVFSFFVCFFYYLSFIYEYCNVYAVPVVSRTSYDNMAVHYLLCSLVVLAGRKNELM